MSSPSTSQNQPDGMALIWIFDHCSRYPGSYEIPLRDMYALNCHPTKSFVGGSSSPETAFSPRNSTSTQASNSSQESTVDAAADFRSQLIHQISRMPSQPCSLPPAFLTSFLRRCFPKDLEQVDFPQGLTALDYARDLENRWKKEMSLALQRLGVERQHLEKPTESDLAKKYPGVMTWVESILAKARDLEALYTQIYIGLRRWMIVNEILLEPHNKHNHIALLNTLYPPVSAGAVTPTPQLTYQLLKSHRDTFFRLINKVSTRGTESVQHLVQQSEVEQDTNSWSTVYSVLDKFLTQTTELIDEGHPRTRKVDSGCSFGAAVPEGMGSTESVAEDAGGEKPLPQFPVLSDKDVASGKGSMLERLSRELRSLGPAAKLRSLRKMKSTAALTRPSSQQSSNYSSSIFEVSEEKRDRLIRDAYTRKNSQSNMSTSTGNQ
ncbi:hypothetical protein N7539_001324 [Penicillium diatomitis]|uniref:Uncharacterized protein n=1 Tax=Penicillium diatomitis TaxID=2819901 RepID=A0A9X0BZM8_9EURO|nr:uncharacterized protein N7539_001324 [Penicillium diatomitis]KAJ5492578.1 hypothetical protein N7539_001324 [Penicillium diatomitis]